MLPMVRKGLMWHWW